MLRRASGSHMYRFQFFLGENYLFEGFTFDGLADKQSVLHGKGYHNLFGRKQGFKSQNPERKNSKFNG